MGCMHDWTECDSFDHEGTSCLIEGIIPCARGEDKGRFALIISRRRRRRCWTALASGSGSLPSVRPVLFDACEKELGWSSSGTSRKTQLRTTSGEPNPASCKALGGMALLYVDVEKTIYTGVPRQAGLSVQNGEAWQGVSAARLPQGSAGGSSSSETAAARGCGIWHEGMRLDYYLRRARALGGSARTYELRPHAISIYISCIY
jgi:hypothetical protein